MLTQGRNKMNNENIKIENENKKHLFKRIFVIVTDSLGVGALPDALKYGDQGSNTLEHIANTVPSFKAPFLEELGMGSLINSERLKPVAFPKAFVTKLQEVSVGKDTLTGHFELMGLKVTKAFPSFTDTGFPKELIEKLEKYSNRPVIGNVAASGTEIMKELGEEQIRTGALIVYTSADSVLQIAANEEVVPLEELYKICEYARKITIENPKWMVGRIIARPFVGKTADTFTRTTNRHDYAIKPFSKTMLDVLAENKYDVIAIGKINDIFDGEGVTSAFRTKNNKEGMLIATEMLNKDFTGLCFTNLVDFDALYGHRRDPYGYAKAIMDFDKDLKEFCSKMQDTDLVMVVADHGNDPTHTGTDHTREYVPLICYHNAIKGATAPAFVSHACVAQTIAENFKLQAPDPNLGVSLMKHIKSEEK